MNEELANLIFPNITKTVEDYELMYPERKLEDGAKVTRYAPSPTGFIHIGALLSSFTANVIARQSKGVYYLRIEDTDTARTVENGVNTIIEGLKEFGVEFDEGPQTDGTQTGNYGPYVQSERKEIYHAFIKHLIIKGLAYPCFCTKEEINTVREHQTETKKRIGYYGKYA
ncbi:MAG: glutamate--tRNA ligase family protein, partial [Bacilli bacterium]